MRHQGQRAVPAARDGGEPVHRPDQGLFTGITADLLQQGTGVLFTAFGRSMTPTIRHGDTLHVAPPDAGVRVGSIILYTSERGRTVAAGMYFVNLKAPDKQETVRVLLVR